MVKHTGTIPLESERLLLRPLTIADAQAVYHNWASDKRVTFFMRWNIHESIEDTVQWLKECENAQADPTFYNWGIIIKETNTLIGSIGLIQNEEYPGRYEIGYCIAYPYWGKGYTSEAAARVMDYAKNEVGLTRFVGVYALDNPVSGRILRKLGFVPQYEGVYHSYDGKREYVCSVLYLDCESAAS